MDTKTPISDKVSLPIRRIFTLPRYPKDGMPRTTWICLALLPSLLPGALCAQTPKAAFLDAFDKVTVGFDQPLTLPDANAFSLTINGQPVSIKRVEPRGPATAPVDKGQVVLPGTIQSALGGNEWDPNGQITRMTKVSPGVFEFTAAFPKGDYQYKVAVGGSWGENYGANFEPGGQNIDLRVPKNGTIVKFIVDFNKKTVLDSLNNPSQVTPPTSIPPKTTSAEPAKYQSFTLLLERPLTKREVVSQTLLATKGVKLRLIGRGVFDDPAYFYPKHDLGATYTLAKTTFKVWSPASVSASVVFPDQNRIVPMHLGSHGVWYTSVNGDLNTTAYFYRFVSYGETRDADDVCAKGAYPQFRRSAVIDLSQTNPHGWPAPRPFSSTRQTDAIIYEAHIRDLTSSPTSGVKPAWRGKYLGLTQPNTVVLGTKSPTALAYLKSLGITHLHLLPFQDFNPNHQDMYNWGYETSLFNVPEEQYSTRPQNPLQTIKECKSMVQSLQKSGIGVVLDVVYNHSVPSEGKDSAFWQTMPYYYVRTDDLGNVLNESGVGNALDDDRPMVRKYIIDSAAYWVKEYRLDGLRFDLMGMFNKETITELTKTVRKINPALLVYGEPWTGGGPNRSPKGSYKSEHIAVFNDDFRNLLKGGLDDGRPGYIDGADYNRQNFINGLLGSPHSFAAKPDETINYITAHDNLALWDAISLSRPKATLADHKKSLVLAQAALLLAQGIPFLEGGAELGRTKGGNPNSYNSGDSVNQFDWKRGLEFQDTAQTLKQLVKIRKDHPVFRLATAAQIKSQVTVLPWQDLPENTVALLYDGKPSHDSWSKTLVIFHNGVHPTSLNLPPGHWTLAFGIKDTTQIQHSIQIPPLSVLVLYQN